MTNFAIRPARPEDAEQLSVLAQRSKAHWGYDEEFLSAFRSELTIRAESVVPRRTQVAVGGKDLGGTDAESGLTQGAEPEERILGFATLEGEAPAGELGMLFVDPDVIGQGVGTGLFKHISSLATQLGFHRLTIASDPFAEPFYLAQGAVRIGAVPSGSIPGRSLPLLALAL
ncbi:GNAT family N-acetyltransferase [Actinospica durhamensis]|uniref:GNAT family N-acetyltransferase n=1 Tax=Actinospica durhamensis TaxID=1508375 RepID=A0A941IUU9_9ACTN|nr:GNAT family N-acetyltransferase [Actinospica durhamensis]MBR7838078.1 GNAT family N-acetyltransferase [Actinospica durhamensis]